MTTFADLVISLGSIPCLGGALLPFPGNYWWVNETTGNDGFPGNTPTQPFASLARAQAVATAGNNDVVFLSGTVHTTATIAWAKDQTHLIGLTAPSNNGRARISSSGSTVFTPMVNVTGQGCVLANFGTFYGYDDASTQICWAEAGGRNFYSGVLFGGGGNATAAAQAGMRSLTVAGSGENLFSGCTVGLDTVVRATNANASLEFLSATPRNVFNDCILQSDVSTASDVHVTIGSGGIDRYVLFKRCTFLNAINSGATAMSVAFTVNASAGGSVLLQDCASVGATVYATTGPIYVTGAVPDGGTSGLAVAAT